MEIILSRGNPQAVDADALIVLEWEGGRNPVLLGPLTAIYESGEITGKAFDFTLLHGVAGFKATRVLVAGGGKREKFDTAALRKLCAAAIRRLKGKGVKSVALALEGDLATAANVAAAAECAVTGNWEPDHLKTDKENNKNIASLTLVVSGGNDLEAALERGAILGKAANLTREIAVEPPNLLTPLALAERARRVAEAAGLSIDVLDGDRMKQLGMGALLGVAQGSDAPPALIVLQYKPEKPVDGVHPNVHLGFVGKGVTFDTGGISIKPAEGMEKMKYDMCGGAAVIGAMYAIAHLRPSVAVTGVIPTVENMPGGNAQRPGDIVKSYSGKTVEILNTDAEGRLILADAITYAKQLGCTHLVDAATLTGAIVVALGHLTSGVFTNDDDLASKWMAAAGAAGERMWRMPLYDEYRDQLKTVYADIQNIGTRWGGACTAAMFLKEFVGDTPWVHVDVAGTAWLDDAKPDMAKGPTAIPLRTFVELAMEWRK